MRCFFLLTKTQPKIISIYIFSLPFSCASFVDRPIRSSFPKNSLIAISSRLGSRHPVHEASSLFLNLIPIPLSIFQLHLNLINAWYFFPRHRRRTPATNSGESSTEGDSSHQSQRSVVYLHATTGNYTPLHTYMTRKTYWHHQ